MFLHVYNASKSSVMLQACTRALYTEFLSLAT